MNPRFAISAFYFTYLGALGIFWPYFSIYLRGVGLTDTEVTHLMALYPVMGLVAPPLFGLLADEFEARGWILRVVSGLTLLAFLGFFAAAGARVPLYVALGLFAFCRAPVLPLTDASALEAARCFGGSYGQMRVWGSLGFLVAALATGALVQTQGSHAVLPATVVTLALAAATAWLLPAPPPHKDPQAVAAMLHLLRDGRLWLFLVAAVFGQMATGAYDAGFSLHLGRLGLGARFVGTAWAVGVTSEVIFMIYQGALFRRFTAERAFAFALAVAAVRWALLAQVRSPAAILALQPLHGITFGCFYTGAVTVMRDRGGEHATAASQGLLAAALGLGSMTGMWMTGRLLEEGGGHQLYLVASGMAAFGCLAAVAYVWKSRGRTRP